MATTGSPIVNKLVDDTVGRVKNAYDKYANSPKKQNYGDRVAEANASFRKGPGNARAPLKKSTGKKRSRSMMKRGM